MAAHSERQREVFRFFEIPNWGVRLIVLFIVIGSPGALVLAWAFELTRKGIERTEDVGPNEPRRRRTGRQLTALIMVAAVIASGLLIFKSLGPPRGAVRSVKDEEGRPPEDASRTIPPKSIAILLLKSLVGSDRISFR